MKCLGCRYFFTSLAPHFHFLSPRFNRVSTLSVGKHKRKRGNKKIKCTWYLHMEFAKTLVEFKKHMAAQ